MSSGCFFTLRPTWFLFHNRNNVPDGAKQLQTRWGIPRFITVLVVMTGFDKSTFRLLVSGDDDDDDDDDEGTTATLPGEAAQATNAASMGFRVSNGVVVGGIVGFLAVGILL